MIAPGGGPAAAATWAWPLMGVATVVGVPAAMGVAPLGVVCSSGVAACVPLLEEGAGLLAVGVTAENMGAPALSLGAGRLNAGGTRLGRVYGERQRKKS